ncbi:MAG: hypothetical protein ACK5NB_06515 [Flavobacteriaceae bacterium]
MKYFFIILSLLLTGKDCSQKKENENVLSFEYSAVSRGFSKHIKINDKAITVQNSILKKACPQNDWNRLVELSKTIPVETIASLEAPSKKRFFDGAAIANLTLFYNDSIYKTPSFDHGNPPAEIAELVKEILSISENIE